MNKSHDSIRQETVDQTLKMVRALKDVFEVANVDPNNRNLAIRTIRNSYLRGPFAMRCYKQVWGQKCH